MREKLHAATRVAARAREKAAQATQPAGAIGGSVTGFAAQQAWADKINAGMGNPAGSTGAAGAALGVTDSGRAGGMRPEDADATDQHKRETLGKPILRGFPVDTGSVLGESSTTGDDSGVSEWIRQWATNQGLNVDYSDAQEAAKTGEFVYVGQEEDKAGGAGYKRDVYVYKDDASAGIANFSEDQLRSYQAQLGLTESGLVDPKLQALWNQAVEVGQTYARAGKKVELQFIFDNLVAAVVAAGGLGGGGGGGGARDRGDTDYYFDMMQVLGDISGVKGGQ